MTTKQRVITLVRMSRLELVADCQATGPTVDWTTYTKVQKEIDEAEWKAIDKEESEQLVSMLKRSRASMATLALGAATLERLAQMQG